MYNIPAIFSILHLLHICFNLKMLEKINILVANMTLMKHFKIDLKLQICCHFSQFMARINKKMHLLKCFVYF
jgi:hypothetical protein